MDIDPDKILDDAAALPASATVGDQSVTQHPLRDLMDYARQRRSASLGRGVGFRLVRVVPGGHR